MGGREELVRVDLTRSAWLITVASLLQGKSRTLACFLPLVHVPTRPVDPAPQAR